MMTKPGESSQQRTVIDATNSPAAVSIFFGKTSIDRVKEIVRKRSSSFPRQYSHEDAQDYSSPGSVGKMAAFFDQYIRFSGLQKTSETSEFSNVKSDNKISLASSIEKSDSTMYESITTDKYEDHSSYLPKDLKVSTANESLLEDTKVESLALVSGSNPDVYKVEKERASQQIGNRNVPVAIYGLNSMGSTVTVPKKGSFQASQKHEKQENSLSENVANSIFQSKGVQLEDNSIGGLTLGEEYKEKHAQASVTNCTQMKSSTDYKQEKFQSGHSAAVENNQNMLKESFRSNRTSKYVKKVQQSNLDVHKTSLTSTSAYVNLRKGRVNGPPTRTRTDAPVDCSKINETVSSLAKGSRESQESGNIRTSADLHARNKEFTRTTWIKTSSRAINGRLLEGKDLQHRRGRGINSKDAENKAAGKEGKFDHQSKEIRPRLMPTKTTSQMTYKEAKIRFEKNGCVSTKSHERCKICIGEHCSNPPAAIQNAAQDHDHKNISSFLEVDQQG